MTADELNKKLAEIKPGKTYPRYIKVVEDGHTLEWHMESYFVGMYCAVHIDGQVAMQTGDHNNKTFITKLKRDIKGAMERGSEVEIGNISPVKEMP